MANCTSERTLRALARIRAGSSAYAAAVAEGLAVSTVYRAIARHGLTLTTGQALDRGEAPDPCATWTGPVYRDPYFED